MTDDQQRHITSAIRNNMIHHSPFEPVPGHRYVWNDGTLYRLHENGDRAPLMQDHEIYDMDDNALHARAIGEVAPLLRAPTEEAEEEIVDEEEESEHDEEEVAADEKPDEEEVKEKEEEPVPPPVKKQKKSKNG